MLARKKHIRYEKHKRQKQKRKHKKATHLSLVSDQQKPSTVKRSSTSSIALLLHNVTRLGATLAAVKMAKADEITLMDPEGRIYELFCSLKCDDLVNIAISGRFDRKRITANLTNLPHQLVGNYKCNGNHVAHIFQNGSIPLNSYGEYLRSELNIFQNSCDIDENVIFPIDMVIVGVVGLLILFVIYGFGKHLVDFECKKREYEPVLTRDYDSKVDDSVKQLTDLESVHYQSSEEAISKPITQIPMTSLLNRV